MLASLTEPRSYRVQRTDGDLGRIDDPGSRNICILLARGAVADSPVLSSTEPVTPELERSLHEYYDRYVR